MLIMLTTMCEMMMAVVDSRPGSRNAPPADQPRLLVTLLALVALVAPVTLVAPSGPGGPCGPRSLGCSGGPGGDIAGQAHEVHLRLTASLKSWLNHPHPVLLQGDGVVGGVRPERKLHPDSGPSLQDDKAAGRQALRPFHQPLPPAIPRQVSCVDLLPQPQ